MGQCQYTYPLGRKCKIATSEGQKLCRHHVKIPINAGCNPNSQYSAIAESSDKTRDFRRAPITKMQADLYIKQLGPKLSVVCRELLNNTKLNDITAEIAVTRTAYLESIGEWGSLAAMIDDDQIISVMGGGIDEAAMQRGRHKLQQMIATARNDVVEGMDRISVLCERQAKIHNLTVDKLPPDAIDGIVKQICRFVHLCFAHDWANIEKFNEMLNQELQLPSLKMIGTMSTPSQDVREMYDTIPRAPEIIDAEMVV